MRPSLRPTPRVASRCYSGGDGLSALQPEAVFESVFDLAERLPKTSDGADAAALNSLFQLSAVQAGCVQPGPLSAKYGAADVQNVLSITNKATLEQTWYNRARTQKPQTFTSSEGNKLEDPTDGGKRCDFCDWQNLTAEDSFGRVETATCVTASNLFKYCAPYHGLIVFKEHHPLKFGPAVIADLMTCTAEWLKRAAACPGDASASRLHPFLLWNCLSRAGASQFHGHAQVMASSVPLPQAEKMAAVIQHRPDYYDTVFSAHRAAGLSFEAGEGDDCAWGYVNLTSVKDMEVVVCADNLRSAGLHHLLHAALRTLIDDFGAVTFNVGVLNIEIEGVPTDANGAMAPVMARVVSRGKLSSKASDFGGLEVFAGASIGHTDPFTIIRPLKARIEDVAAAAVAEM